jgi:hypothetical protein
LVMNQQMKRLSAIAKHSDSSPRKCRNTTDAWSSALCITDLVVL